jgi:hypothetical protein
MDNKKISVIAALAVILIFGVQGCGGGVGGGDQYASGGIGGSGVTVGSVSGFGSVFVNGIEFDTAAAVVVVDGAEQGTGDQAVLDHLAVGKIVRVEGPSDDDGTGRARRIAYNEDIIGPVTEVAELDPNTRRITVMGQIVIVDSLTSFAETALTAVAPGHFVEVSGFAGEMGAIFASYFRRIAPAMPPGAEVQLRGVAAGVDAGLRSFVINRLEVDYSAADVSRLAGEAPADGQYVEVKGVLNDGGVLIAASVAPEDIVGVETADDIMLAGIVTGFVSPSEFAVGGIPVATDDTTTYKGIVPEEIGLGSKLKVKGSLFAGVILADRIESAALVKLESTVRSLTIAAPESAALTLEGLESIEVNLNGLTKILGSPDIGGIDIGDRVKVFGRSFSSGRVTAEKLIVKSTADSRLSIKGVLEAIEGDVLTVLGVRINTASIPSDGFSIDGAGPISAARFRALASVGDSVTAIGVSSGIEVNWRSIELSESD